MGFFDLRTGKKQNSAATVGGFTPDFLLEVAKGNVPGHTPLNKFGSNLSSSADLINDMWDGGGVYTWPDSSQITHIKQSSDQAALRGGAFTVYGLTNSFTLFTQTVSLDNTDTTSQVALTTPLRRVYRVIQVISNTASSDVAITNSGGSVEYAKVLAGNAQTLMSMYTVPASHSLYILNYYASVVDATNKTPTSTEVKLWTRGIDDNHPFAVKHADGINASGPPDEHVFGVPFKVHEKHDIKLTTLCAGQPGNVHGGYDGVLVENPTR